MAQGTVTKVETADGVRWRVRVDMIDPQTGSRVRPQRTYKTRREAEAGLTQWRAEIDRGMAVLPSGKTVGEYLAFWLDTRARHRVRATTFVSYQRLVRLYIVPTLGSVVLQRLSAAQIQALYSSLLARGGRAGTSLAPRTVRYVHAILRRALKDALALDLVPRNVTEAVAPPKAPRPPIKGWTASDLRRFMAVAHADGYSPLWLLAAHTGMRQGELLGLRWQDIDLERGVCRIVQAVPTVHHGIEFTPPKTASGRRTIALDTTCIAALRTHKARQNAQRLVVGAAWHEYDLALPSAIGTPLNHSNVYHRFIKLAADAGLPRIPFHGLRHTHATLLMQAGVHPKVVSERLGHADISLTLSTYSHVLPQMQEEAAVIFDGAMKDVSDD